MTQFLRSTKFGGNKDNHYVFYLLQVLIFQMAHSRLDSCEHLLDYNFVNTDPHVRGYFRTNKFYFLLALVEFMKKAKPFFFYPRVVNNKE